MYTWHDVDTGGSGNKRHQPAQLSERAIYVFERTNALGGGMGEVGGDTGGRGGGVASRQLKEMSFLQDLAAVESEERERSFKVRSTLSLDRFPLSLFSPPLTTDLSTFHNGSLFQSKVVVDVHSFCLRSCTGRFHVKV